ncbi:MAG: peptidoglycan-binding protein [Pseudorhodoplanes sp.]
MRAVLWLLLGVMTAGVASWLMPVERGEGRLAVITEIANEKLAKVEQAPAPEFGILHSRIHAFSPRIQLDVRYAGLTGNDMANTGHDGGSPWSTNVMPAKSAAPAESPLPAAAWQDRPEALPASQIVLSDAVLRIGTQATVADKPALDDGDNIVGLTRDLQRELKRVGCYAGEIDGDWGPLSKRAMSAFTSRVNAALPVDKPDAILLTLVRGHTALACGIQCPSGSAEDASGRCMPRAILAHAATVQTKTWVASVNSTPQQMASVPDQPRRTVSHESGKDTTRVIIRPSTRSATVLPGRMAIGALAAAPPASLTSGGSTASTAVQSASPSRSARARAYRASRQREARAAPRSYRSSRSRAWTATFFDRY